MHKKRNDLILIVFFASLILIGLVSLFLYMKRQKPVYVKIYYENELVEMIEIQKNYECTIHEVEIKIQDKKVYVQNSPCYDHVCMHQGKIHLPGQTITCLPQRVVIRIDGEGVDIGI